MKNISMKNERYSVDIVRPGALRVSFQAYQVFCP